MKQSVIIHPHVDLDACACVAFAGADIEQVHFLPAGAKAIPETCGCCGCKLTDPRVLDHPLGEKGRLEDNGIRHAAVCSMPEVAGTDPLLLEEIDEQDSIGKTFPRFTLADILAGLKVDAGSYGMREDEVDRETLLTMGKIIRGLDKLYRRKQEARILAEKTPVVDVGSYRVALTGPEKPILVGQVLSQVFGVHCGIYDSREGIGIVRYPESKEPDLRKLIEHLPGWFVHTAGFIAAWGTFKSPAKGPPPTGTPQTAQELLELMQRVYG